MKNGALRTSDPSALDSLGATSLAKCANSTLATSTARHLSYLPKHPHYSSNSTQACLYITSSLYLTLADLIRKL
jgi:hypothetical protein